MSERSRDKYDQVERLLLEIRAGEASEEEVERLNSLLLGDDDLRRHIARQLLDDAVLREELQTSEVATLFGDKALLPLASAPATSGQRGSASRFWLGFATAGVVAVLALVVVVMRWRSGDHEQRIAEALPNDSFAMADLTSVAVLTQTVDVQWADKSPQPAVGEALPPGRLTIERGLLQIEFLNGATVVLEGPAEFELISAIRGFCYYGKLTAEAPPQARGFTIGTSRLDVVDLGTEFAVQVGRDGQGEVHVLDGKVSLRGTGEQPLITRPFDMTGGRAIRFDAEGRLEEQEADRTAFVGRAQVMGMADNRQQAVYARWRTFSEKLRTDPDAILYYTFENHEPSERRLRSDLGDPSLDGAIIGCQWSEGRWPGKGALEFKSVNDRVRVDVPGEYETLTFMAWLRIDGFDRWLSSLLMADGWEPGEAHWQLSDRGHVVLGVKDGDNHFTRELFSPNDLGRWVHLVVVYDLKAGRINTYVDGKSRHKYRIAQPTPIRIGPAEIGNWNRKGLHERDRQAYQLRSLNGRLDEIAVFKRALTAEEVHEMYEAGCPAR